MDVEVLGDLVELAADGTVTDFSAARDLAKERALAMSANAMLLSWRSGLTGDHQPKIRCGGDPRPPWIVWAASRGADLTVSVNRGDWVFYFLL